MDRSSEADAAAKAAGDLRTGAEQAAGEVRAAANEASEFVSDKVRTARQAVERTTDDALNWIRARPVASVLIAAGVGYLLGRLVRR